MPQRTDTFDLARLRLTSGEGRRLDLHVHVDPFDYGGSRYAVAPDLVEARLDVSRTTGNGWALRLRFSARIDGPCMRCLENATPTFESRGARDGNVLSKRVQAAIFVNQRDGRPS